MSNEQKTAIQEWAEKIDWKDRVKAVCKPCWEIKYCPYGPLVEEFPLREERTEKSCRIFGHDCPVFHIAEPFTETKELRKITRHIPRPTQFKVMRRENNICEDCGESVKDENIEFDHKIPLSKGGSSEMNNIRLLCSECNRKKGADFEDEFLVDDIHDHLSDDEKRNIQDESILEFLKFLIEFAHSFNENNDKWPDENDFAECLADGEKTDAEIESANLLEDVIEFFTSKKPYDLTEELFVCLQYRWGFEDGEIHSLDETIENFENDADEILQAEKELVSKLGFRMQDSEEVDRNWLDM